MTFVLADLARFLTKTRFKYTPGFVGLFILLLKRKKKIIIIINKKNYSSSSSSCSSSSSSSSYYYYFALHVPQPLPSPSTCIVSVLVSSHASSESLCHQ